MGNLESQNVLKDLSSGDGRRVRLLMSDSNWLEQSAIDQLVAVSKLQGMHFVVGMPDLHPGKGQPIGAAFISKNVIYPHLVGSDIGCGMALWKLDVKRRKVKLEKWEKRLSMLSDDDVGAFLSDQDRLSPLEPFNTNGRENKLGTIGGGNHFTEIQCVQEIFKEDEFVENGFDKESVVMLVHSGSRGLGQQILHDHVSAFAAKGITGSEIEGYLEKHDYADKWAKENRKRIADRFRNVLGVGGEQVLDVSHNHVRIVSAEQQLSFGLTVQEGGQYWIHRKGSSPTDNGLVMIPGSRGSLSYLVKPKTHDQAILAMGGFSLAHGAGRKWKRSDCKGRLQLRFKAKDLETTSLGGRVICKQRDLLYEEAPQAYKDIEVVVSDLVDAGMIDVIASFKPLITYKTTRK